MKALLVLIMAACGGAEPAPKPTPPPSPSRPPATTLAKWHVPEGWKSETIPFPFEFAPTLAHRGHEELRFAPGMFDPAKPGYWSYTFIWRVEDPATLDATALSGELTTYFAGLIDAVDRDKKITARSEIAVRAKPDGPGRFTLTAHLFDAFKTQLPIDLTGWAARTPCGSGALWVFVFSPATSALRGELDTLARSARCGQPTE